MVRFVCVFLLGCQTANWLKTQSCLIDLHSEFVLYQPAFAKNYGLTHTCITYSPTAFALFFCFQSKRYNKPSRKMPPMHLTFEVLYDSVAVWQHYGIKSHMVVASSGSVHMIFFFTTDENWSWVLDLFKFLFCFIRMYPPLYWWIYVICVEGSPFLPAEERNW